MRKLKSSIAWCWLLLFAACSGEEIAEVSSLHGISGSEGALVWLESSDGTVPAALQGFDGDQWSDVSTNVLSKEWFFPLGTNAQAYRLRFEGGAVSDELVPNELLLDIGTSDGQQVFLADEEAVLWASVEGAPEYPLQTFAGLTLIRDDKVTTKRSGPYPLSPSTVDDVVLLSASQTQVVWELKGAPESVGRANLEFGLSFETKTMGDLLVSKESLTLVFVGYQIYWGDLHGHSNLSMDGCENGTSTCGDRKSTAGSDYFSNAKANGLDFAAITDHAEYVAYASDGTDATKIGIWSTQAEHVRDAAEEGFVPILGYEWTHGDDDGDGSTGGHRTVLFDGDELCADYFVASDFLAGRSKQMGPGFYYGGNRHFNESVSGLQADIVEATKVCNPVQSLMFSHHTAMLIPQHLDWTLPQNEPNPETEMLIEIFSEHGSSELLNPEEEGAFGVDPSKVYVPEGSVQQALLLGYKLGFVGGTDNHDGRPGSLEDGPSCPDFWNAEGPICQFHGGGLTGVLSDELSRSAIFSTLSARRTVVTTGPRDPIRAVLVGSSGSGYPFGALVPVDDAPYQLYLDTTGSAAEVTRRQLVTSDGEVIELPSVSHVKTQIEVDEGGWVYLRLSLQDSLGDHRVWVSPWFWE
jgi:hypothetical protein